MWLIALMLLLMLPMTAAALVFLVVALWRALDALLQGTIGAVRLTWRAAVWIVGAGTWALHKGCSSAHHLRRWHEGGSTWAGQYLLASWHTWSNVLRRRYIAGQLRRLRRARRQ